jgi:colanic acid/amylovoran biosynthesis glycosyltransferase
MAYLFGQYPTVSHSFLLREVRALRFLGLELNTVSISDPDRPTEAMSPEERDELSRTFYVKRLGLLCVLVDQVAMLFGSPVRYVRGLTYALKLGGFNPRRIALRLFYLAEAVVIGRWMKRKGLTHCHTHFSSTVALLLKQIFPVSVSMTIHGSAEFEEPTEFHLQEKIAAADFVIGISNYGKSQMMRFSSAEHWGKIEAIPLGIDPAKFAPAPFRERPSPFEIVCVGRLVPVKAHRVLFEAVARLIEEGYDLRLRLVGDGPDRVALESIARGKHLNDRIIFEGWRSEVEVVEILQRADAFALASFAEGLPVVLMEAMAIELPCVATGITGIPELIQDGISGLLVPPAEPDALANALARLIDDPGFRREVGHAGRRAVIGRFELAANAERLARLFESKVGVCSTAGRAINARGVTEDKNRKEIPFSVDDRREAALTREV